jgi:leukotriene-A4 hydrolase
MKSLYLLLLSLLLIIAIASSCNRTPPSSETQVITKQSDMYTQDPHSFARPLEAVVRHLDLDLAVDFPAKTISGIASYKIDTDDKATKILFDTDNLTITKVTLDKDDETADFKVSERIDHLGSPLEVSIKPNTKVVHIHYSTTPESAALQWLSPQQTAGKKHPFLFTQGQAILTRTWIPIQDSPGIRLTYNAKVTVPSQLLAVMSADNPTTRTDDGVYDFTMDKPIPAYLIALSVGDLAFASTGKRTGVYAEPLTLQKAADEFAEMEKMLEAAEDLYGDYAWGRYDLIVLPPSFPFGGMENPKLTFATPTILAGDRSLTSLVAHELAHSWSGNLVTNATWNDFWLNEGFTVYFERRIMEALYSASYAEMLAELGFQDLEYTVADLGSYNPLTQLKLDLKGKNPDDGMNDIPYEKGYALLVLIENYVGREKFDEFLKNYFQRHAFSTMTTESFIEYLQAELFKGNREAYNQLRIDEWIYKPGIPDNAIKPDAERFRAVERSFENWLQTGNLQDSTTQQWSSHEWLHFLRLLPQEISADKLASVDKKFGFTNSGNAELQAAWYEISIRNGYKAAYPAIRKFLVNVGRRKFLVPLYKALSATSEGKTFAREVYLQARPNYHYVASSTIDNILGVSSSARN